jgi:hypothetical protein
MASKGEEPETREFEQVLVDHAVRCWQAECENAARLSARATLFLSAMAALFGLGLYRIEWFRSINDRSRMRWEWSIWSVKCLLSLALFIFAFSFYRILGRRMRMPNLLRKIIFPLRLAIWKLFRRKILKPTHRQKILKVGHRKITSVHSSDYLALPEWIFTEGTPVGPPAKKLVFQRVYRAYLDLQGRNAETKEKLDSGQQWFVIGLMLVLLAIVLYIITSEPPI